MEKNGIDIRDLLFKNEMVKKMDAEKGQYENENQ